MNTARSPYTELGTALEIRPIRTIEEFRRLEPDWRKLEAADPDCPIMGSFDWIDLWWSTFGNVQSDVLGQKKSLLILCAFANGDLVAAAPFIEVTRRSYGIPYNCIEFLGQQWGGMFQDILKRPDLDCDAGLFLAALRKCAKYDVVFLKQIPSRSRRFPPARLVPYAACPELSLHSYRDFEAFASACSKKLRGNLRQGLRRIEKENVKFAASSPQVDDAVVDTMKTISRSKLQDSKRWLWDDPLKESFYRGLFSRFDSFAAIIRLDDRPAVYFANLIFKSGAYCIDAAYDRAFPKFELGNLSVHHSIRTAFDRDLDFICMGPGMDDYKLRQANHLENLCAYMEAGNTYPSIALTWLVKRAASRRSARFLEERKSMSLMGHPGPAE